MLYRFSRRVWEKIMETLSGKMSDGSQGAVKRRLVRACRGAAEDYHIRGADSLWYRLGQSILYGKVKSALGLDRCATFLTGAAPISEEVVRFFAGFDIALHDVYGLSETTGSVVLNTKEQHRLGTAGVPMPGIR